MNKNIVQLLFCAFVVCFPLNPFSQEKFKFGLSFQETAGILTSRKRNITQVFETLHVTKYEGKLSEKQKHLWTTSEIGFHIKLPSEKWEFTSGLRMFNWRYHRDSIIRHYSAQVYVDTQNGPWPVVVKKEAFGRSKRNLSTVVPFITLHYVKPLGKKSSISYSLSIGYFGLFQRKAERNFAYEKIHDIDFDVYNYDIIKFKPKRTNNLYAFDCRISADYRYLLDKNLRFNTGLSYYYAQNGMTLHHGLYGNVGVIMFINEPREYPTPSESP